MSGQTDISSADRALADLLHARGHRVTPQRLVINRLLRAREAHLTAEQLHAAATDDLPGTSLPTVYATLDLFVELGLVRRLRTGAAAALYDSRTSAHQHAVCRVCGAVHDLDMPAAAAAPELAGFTVERVDVTVEGVCADCGATA